MKALSSLLLLALTCSVVNAGGANKAPTVSQPLTCFDVHEMYANSHRVEGQALLDRINKVPSLATIIALNAQNPMRMCKAHTTPGATCYCLCCRG
jgi:hypothetical protein